MKRKTGYTHILFYLFLSFLFFRAEAQFVDYGTDPARYKWNYIKTPHYKLIYPQGTDSVAQRYITFLENVFPHMGNTIGDARKTTFPVILHPGSMLSNGMVAWAPKRMELITTPSSDLYAQSWDRQLAIHESRHVFQTGRLFQGIFKPLYYLAGEQIGGVVDLGVPKWFFEGDAVVAETAMSNSGRGRLPEFNMFYRTQMLSDDFFSFDKWAMGSYKDYTGNYYALGFDMAAYARYRHGGDVWDKVLDRYAKRIYAIPPFTNALKHYTGLTTGKLFKETFQFLKEEWEIQDEAIGKPDNALQLSPGHKLYTSYKYPQAIDTERILAVKSGLNDINSLVSLENGKEKRLTYLGNLSSRIIYRNGKVYWTEYVYGLRWTHENHSVLKSYDINSGSVQTLTPGKRYLAPAIDNSGQLAAVSYYRTDGKNEIVLVNTGDGREVSRFSLPSNLFVKEMTFAKEEQLIAVVVSDQGISLMELNLNSGKWNELLTPTPANITSPIWHNGFLYFESGLSGINNIYRMDVENRVSDRITNARFGVFQPALSPDGKQLLLADYQAEGYRVAAVNVEELVVERADFSDPYLFTLPEEVARQEAFNLDTARLEPVAFEPKPYRKALNLFNIHSWAPFYYDAMDAVNFSADDFSTIVKPGAMILSQDHLNTLIMQAGYYYNDKRHHGKLSFIYMGWYPVIDISLEYGRKPFDVFWGTDDEENTAAYRRYTNRKMVELEGRMYIPFNFTRGHYVHGFQPAVTYYFTNHRYQEHHNLKYHNYQSVLTELRHYYYRRMSQRDILPRWGYQLRLQQLFTPFDGKIAGNLYVGRLITYWPGILRNHSLMLRAGYQYQDRGDNYFYVPERIMDKARGYDIYDNRGKHQVGFKADYAFALFNPDFSIGSLAYIKRIRANLFFDLLANQNYGQSDWTNVKSYGGDLIFDWNALRLNYPLSLGLRIIKPIDYGDVQAEALFSISF